MIRKGSKEAEDRNSFFSGAGKTEGLCRQRKTLQRASVTLGVKGHGSGTPSAYMDRCGSVGTDEKRKENPAIGREDALVFAMSSQCR